MKKAIILNLAIFLIIAPLARCATLTVRPDGTGDYPTIQSAIDAANNGDTVLVHDGVYMGTGNRHISLRGKAITLRSVNGPANSIIEVGASQSDWHRGFYLHEGENETSIIDGFTVTGGYTYTGGGIFVDGSSPTIKNCIITGNTGGWGGGVAFYNSDATIINCLISGNKGWDAAGGIYSRNRNPKITNCTITDNRSQWGSGALCQKTNLTVANSILYDNSPQPQISDRDGNSTISITYSDVQGGWEGYGNINVEPCFVEQGYWDANGVWVRGDYHLPGDSRCINAGDPNYIPEPNETDLNGNPRIVNDRIDMGAYEYNPPIEARLWIFPKVINRFSRQRYVMAWLLLPEGIDKEQIVDEPLLLYPGEVAALRQHIFQNSRRGNSCTSIFAWFDKTKLIEAIPDNGKTELEVIGSLKSDQFFSGSDIVRVRGKGRRIPRPNVNMAPEVAITSPENYDFFLLSQIVTIEADALDFDGEVVEVQFFADEILIGVDERCSNGWRIDWYPDFISDYSLTAKAVDNDGAETVSQSVVISVLDHFPR